MNFDIEMEKRVIHGFIEIPQAVQKLGVNEDYFESGQSLKIVHFLKSVSREIRTPDQLLATTVDANPGMYDLLTSANYVNTVLPVGFNFESLKVMYTQFAKQKIKNKIVNEARTLDYDDPIAKFGPIAADIKRLLSDRLSDKPQGNLGERGEKVHKAERERGQTKGVTTYPCFDEFWDGGLMPKTLTIIAARPAVGKSAFALNLAAQALLQNPNLRIDFFGLEMSEQENYRRLTALFTMITMPKLKHINRLSDEDYRKVLNYDESMKDFDFEIYDNVLSYEDIEQKVLERSQNVAPGNYLAIVDYLQIVNLHVRNGGEYERITKISSGFRRLVSQANIPMVILSQLSRNNFGKSEHSQIPTLADLRGSGSLEQDANNIAFLYDGEVVDGEPVATKPLQGNRTVVFDVKKARDGVIGAKQFTFLGSRALFVPDKS